MKSIINKVVFGIFTTVTFIVFSACNNSNKETTKDSHAAETKADEHNHAEGEENVVTLTNDQMKAVGVEIGTVEQKQLAKTLKVNGALRVPNSNKANATSLFGGVIKQLNVEIGDFVKKGQVVATISNPQFIQLQEEYLSINSRIEFAEQEFNRQKELNDGNAGTKKNLQNATAELKTLRTRKASLSQQLQMMGINPASLSNTNLKASLVVTSPISGAVSNVFAKMGSYVDVSAPIAEIVENTALHLDLQVYEKDISNIKMGQEINFVVTNNSNITYSAKVYSIGSSFSGESKTISVHSRITGDKTGLIDGMNITAIVSLNEALTMAVPNDAIVNADGKYYIFLVEEPQAEKPHEHKEGESHDHDHSNEATNKGTQFKRVEIIKGATEFGYTAITPLTEVDQNAHIAVKGAFFVNAKMNDTGDHGHAH